MPQTPSSHQIFFKFPITDCKHNTVLSHRIQPSYSITSHTHLCWQQKSLWTLPSKPIPLLPSHPIPTSVTFQVSLHGNFKAAQSQSHTPLCHPPCTPQKMIHRPCPEHTQYGKRKQRDKNHKETGDNSDLCARGEVTLHQQAGHCKEQCRTKARSIKRDLKENSGMTESVFTGNSFPSCKVSLNLHKTGYLRTWEMVSVLKVRWWIRWKPQGAQGRVGEGRTCLHKEQPKWWRRITSCSVSVNHHYMLISIPWDISFHATHSNRIFMVWIYLNLLFSLFSRLSNTALSGPVFYILNFTRLTVFLCGSKPIWSI